MGGVLGLLRILPLRIYLGILLLRILLGILLRILRRIILMLLLAKVLLLLLILPEASPEGERVYLTYIPSQVLIRTLYNLKNH